MDKLSERFWHSEADYFIPTICSSIIIIAITRRMWISFPTTRKKRNPANHRAMSIIPIV